MNSMCNGVMDILGVQRRCVKLNIFHRCQWNEIYFLSMMYISLVLQRRNLFALQQNYSKLVFLLYFKSTGCLKKWPRYHVAASISCGELVIESLNHSSSGTMWRLHILQIHKILGPYFIWIYFYFDDIFKIKLHELGIRNIRSSLVYLP